MKKILLITFVMLAFQCCDLNQDIQERTYVLENETERSLELIIYRNELIRQQENVTGKGTLFESTIDNDNGDQIYALAAFDYADSVVVVFDNEKRQSYIFNSSSNVSPPKRNILLDSAYTIESVALYRFTFTEEDYQNAELVVE